MKAVVRLPGKVAEHRGRVVEGLHFVQLNERLKDLVFFSKIRQKIGSEKTWVVC